MKLHPARDLLAKILGRKVDSQTLYRWTTVGVHVGDRLVRLPTKRIGGQCYATREDVLAWIDAQNEHREASHA